MTISLAPASRSPWEIALIAYRAADAALDAHPYAKASPTAANYADLEKDQEPYLQAATASLKALLDTPAPDAAALSEKMEIYAKEFGSEDERALASVVSDVRRFLLRERQPSPIMAMHTRYERAQAEYSIVDKAGGEARHQHGADATEVAVLRTAGTSLVREMDALRAAILHQVPDSWAEALVLQFHVVNMQDMHANCAGEPPEGEAEALQTAIETVFDFMCCEVDQDHGELGASFQAGANRAFFQRRRRTGVVED